MGEWARALFMVGSNKGAIQDLVGQLGSSGWVGLGPISSAKGALTAIFTF